MGRRRARVRETLKDWKQETADTDNAHAWVHRALHTHQGDAGAGAGTETKSLWRRQCKGKVCENLSSVVCVWVGSCGRVCCSSSPSLAAPCMLSVATRFRRGANRLACFGCKSSTLSAMIRSACKDIVVDYTYRRLYCQRVSSLVWCSAAQCEPTGASKLQDHAASLSLLRFLILR